MLRIGTAWTYISALWTTRGEALPLAHIYPVGGKALSIPGWKQSFLYSGDIADNRRRAHTPRLGQAFYKLFVHTYLQYIAMMNLYLPSILVPLVGLVFPAIAMAGLFLYIEKEQLS